MPPSSLTQAREICIEKGYTPGTEFYSRCFLFEENRIADEISARKKAASHHKSK